MKKTLKIFVRFLKLKRDEAWGGIKTLGMNIPTILAFLGIFAGITLGLPSGLGWILQLSPWVKENIKGKGIGTFDTYMTTGWAFLVAVLLLVLLICCMVEFGKFIRSNWRQAIREIEIEEISLRKTK